MAGDIFGPLASGGRWFPKTREINAFRAAARAHRDQRGGPTPPAAALGDAASAIVLVKNTTEEPLEAGRLLALGDVLVPPATDPAVVLSPPVFEGEEATADTEHAAILLDPIADGGVGRAAIPNAAWARVDVTDADHDRAKIVAGTLLESAASGPFPIVWKETGTGEKWAVVLLGGGGSSSSPPATMGLLIADVPATTVTYLDAEPWSSIEPGEAAAAIIPLRRDGASWLAKLNEAEDAQVLLRAINSIWPTEIKAGVTTNADKPVVVIGYEAEWPVTMGEETTPVPAFVITQVIYPVTIVKGLTQGAVTGGSFTADNLVTWWGRSPGVSSLSSIANPAGLEGEDNAVCILMQIPDGSWVCLGIEYHC